jgi:nucleoside-diphosphate-sugar epimerase
MSRIIITGASGFIGRHVIGHFLHDGFDVHCITREAVHDPLLAESGATWHEMNLLHPHGCRKLFEQVRPTHLLHLAWCTKPGEFWNSESNLDWLAASIELLADFVTSGGKRATFAGSCAEYDWRYGYLTEGLTPTVAESLYGASKNGLRGAAEQYCRQKRVGFSWGRIFFLYGKYEHPSRLVPSIIRPLINSKRAVCASGNQVRDFLNSEDVASALASVALSEIEGAINIGSGVAVSIGEVAADIAKIIGGTPLLEYSDEPSQSHHPYVIANIDRLRDEVGWKSAISLEGGLEDAVNWWRMRLKENRSDRGVEP